jgi:hypothetical protein
VPAFATYDLGDPVTLAHTFSADPTTVTLEVRRPSGVWSTVAPTKVSPANYLYTFTPDVSGVWRWKWTGTGPGADVETGALVVRGDVVEAVVTPPTTDLLLDHQAVTTGAHGLPDPASLVVTTDARMSNQRTPLDGSVTDAKVAAANKDGAAGTPSLRTLGTGAQQAARGNIAAGDLPAPATGGLAAGTVGSQLAALELSSLGIDITAGNPTTATMQARLDRCRDEGRTAYFGPRTVTTDATLVIQSACEADSEAVINTDAAVGIQIGTATAPVLRKQITTPKVRRITRAWAPGAVTADAGVKVLRAQSCEVHFQEVKDFAAGVLLEATGGAISYNEFHYSLLWNNAVQLWLNTPDLVGFANQNVHVGGQFSLDSALGVAAAGTRQVRLSATGGGNTPNGNLFLGLSLEGNTPELHLECFGSYNRFLECRWETTGTTKPKVHWGSYDATRYANRNIIVGGFRSLPFTITKGVDAKWNTVEDAGGRRQEFDGQDKGFVLATSEGTDGTLIALLASGTDPGTANPAAVYQYRQSGAFTQWKAAADAFARLFVNHALGRLYFGLGSAAATSFLYAAGQNEVALFSASLSFDADNTKDIGASATVRRPRDVNVGRQITVAGTKVVGAQGLAVADAAGGTTVDTEARAALNALLARLRAHGLIAP